jgi:hypothetical protein
MPSNSSQAERSIGPSAYSIMALLFVALGAPFLLAEPLHAQTAWQAAYWNNPTLTGEPVIERRELDINHNWGTGSPDARIDPDHFSARWTRTITVDQGTYRFTATVDDGLRAWINDTIILDAWGESAARQVQEDLFLAAGTYELRVEYFEAFGAAEVQFERTQLATAPSVAPPAVPTAEFPTAQWRGAYFNNRDLAGEPALVRAENNIDFVWNTASPAPGIIEPETFSARWTRTLDLAPGRYRFSITVDDGGRLYLDDQLVIDQWRDQPPTSYTTELDWAGGPLPVRLDYYENRNGATARFAYAQVLSAPAPTPTPAASDQTADAWRGAYFDNVNLSGEPMLVRRDAEIGFNWGTGSPAPDVLGTDRFSVRWTQTADLESGCYRFIVTADDGVRLRIGGETVIDAFTVQSAQSFNYDANLPGGPTDIVMEYFENTGVAVAELRWERQPCFPAQPTPAPDSPAGAAAATMTGSSLLNVRNGPGVGFRVIDMLERGQTVTVIGRTPSATWIEIERPGGGTGWVNSRYLTGGRSFSALPITS